MKILNDKKQFGMSFVKKGASNKIENEIRSEQSQSENWHLVQIWILHGFSNIADHKTLQTYACLKDFPLRFGGGQCLYKALDLQSN